MPISQRVRDLIASAWPDFYPCLVGTVGPNGPRISPKSSVRVLDDDHLAYWERSKRTALENVRHDSRVCIYFANFAEGLIKFNLPGIVINRGDGCERRCNFRSRYLLPLTISRISDHGWRSAVASRLRVALIAEARTQYDFNRLLSAA